VPHGQRRVSSGWKTNSRSHRELLVADFQVALRLAAFCGKILPGARQLKASARRHIPISHRDCGGCCPPDGARGCLRYTNG
jgi:hypothetical protein